MATTTTTTPETNPKNVNKIPKITVLGSLNIDLVARVPHHPLPGETLTASSFAVSPGGKGANQAVACAKLSRDSPFSSSSSASSSGDGTGGGKGGGGGQLPTAQIKMVGCVGSDSYGDLLRSNLARHGVDVSGVGNPPDPSSKTGIAIIIVDEPTGENRIVLSPEANHAVAAPQVDLALPSTLTDEDDDDNTLPDLLIMQLEIPQQTVLSALSSARDRGVPVLFNPAPAPADGLPGDWLDGLAHLVVNETEAAALSGEGGVDVSVLDTEAGCESVAREFLDKGAENVIITLGGRGVYFMSKLNTGTGTGSGNTGAEVRKGLVPAEKAKVVDTTAAGDTFVGQYALEVVASASASAASRTGGVGREKVFDVEAAVKKANRAAARTVERKGAQDSIPWRDELLIIV